MIIQIAAMQETDEEWAKVIALTDKGELWKLVMHPRDGESWVKMTPLPDDEPNETSPSTARKEPES